MSDIIINRFGERVRFSPSFGAPSNDMLLSDIGLIHGACGRPVSVISASGGYNGLLCSFCGRIPDPGYIPKSIDTWGKFDEWCKGLLSRCGSNPT